MRALSLDKSSSYTIVFAGVEISFKKYKTIKIKRLLLFPKGEA